MQLIDMVWVLFCTSLIFLMQAGFCCLESGMARSKSGINLAVKNILIFCLSLILFWLVGFGLMFGAGYQGLFGTTRFVLSSSGDASVIVFFLFQLVLCGTATTLIAGAVAERMRLHGYLIIVVVTALFIYPLFGHWAWGGVLEGSSIGWLKALGFIDFAGASVVHSVGGWVALAAIIVVGPRIGRFGKDSSLIQGRNLPMATLGALILGFGWIGFNGGSALAITDQVPRILMNTFICGAFGSAATVIFSTRLLGYVDVRYAINGFLSGLVASTAGADAINAWGAMIIGIGGGLIAMGGSLLLARLKIDDAIDVVSTHAFAGSWGILSVAVFADERLIAAVGGRWEAFQVQLLGVVICGLWAFGLSWALFKIIARVYNFRVTSDQEIDGLNISEHGAITESMDLLRDMEAHSDNGNFSSRVVVEPHTEVGQIARDVLKMVELESVIAQNAVEQVRIQSETLGLISDIAKYINFSETKTDALKFALNRIYEYTGWSFGHVFIFDAKKQALISSGLYYSSDKKQFTNFIQATELLEISGGKGIIGRVYNSKVAVWVPDIARESGFIRAGVAAEAGLHAVLAFPVLSGDNIVAVLEFYSLEILDADESLLSAMSEIGIQLGRVFERSAAQTEQKRVERELNLAQKLESVGRLAAGIAHEINTPVQYVSDNTRFLDGAFNDLFLLQKAQTKLLDVARGGSVDPALIAVVEEAMENAETDYLMDEIPKAISESLEGIARIAKIVSAMKQFSHPGSDTKKVIDINDSLESTLTVCSAEWKYVAAVEKDFDYKLPLVLGLPGELGQVFLNLIVNAAHAIADVTDDEKEEGVITLATRHLDNDVEIRISDTGSGIPESSRDKLFESFFTTKEIGKGTGQGLSIARAVVVDQHGGSIDFETELGVGTTFIIRLPIGEECTTSDTVEAI
jgi:Amt family ammonium transporter